MRKSLPVLAIAVLAFSSPMFPSSPPTGGVSVDPPPAMWTFAEALERARSASPFLRSARSAVDAARADFTGARVYPHNPEIGLEAAERSGPDETSTDRGLELSQAIEIGGQRSRRIRAAEARLAAAESVLLRVGQELVNRVQVAFARGLAEEQRVGITRAELGLVENLLSFEERRLNAGAGTQLDLNLARAAAGRARQRLQVDLAARAGARAALAEAVGVDPANPPIPVGSRAEPVHALEPLPDLVQRALAARPDLAASRQALEAARRQVDLQRSLAMPNLRASVFSDREEGDEILGGTIGIAIPLFDRNQGGIARAEAKVASAVVALSSVELAVRRSVAESYARYEAAAESVAALDALVVGTLQESLALLERALEAGKVSAGDVLLLRRELVEARRQHVEAELDLATAATDLRLAVGDLALPSETPPTPGDR